MDNKNLTPLEQEFLIEKERLEKLFSCLLNNFNDKFGSSGLFATSVVPAKKVLEWELKLECRITAMYENYPNIPELRGHIA